MPKLTGQCLCGNVTFKVDGAPLIQANCHCTDCQQTTGAAFATILFFKDSDVEIDGETKSFSHTIENGNTLTKIFCPNCGSQMFTTNSKRPGMIAVRAGVINEKGEIKPSANVFTSSKIASTVLDPALMAFEKMPG